MKREEFSVSAIIPAYNRRGLLPRAIDSVLEQTLPANEIIVVDDGSTDGTAEMITARYPGVVLISQPNRGASAARNAGIREAQHPWIAFLDSDDAWLPDKLEKQWGALAAEPGLQICHGEEIWKRKHQHVKQPARYGKQGGWLFRQCLEVCAISPSAAVVHREVFEKVGLFDEALPACEDYDLWLRICSRFPVACVQDPVVVKHDGHEGQLSHQHSLDRYRIKALRKIIDTGSLSPDDEEAARKSLCRKSLIYAKGARKHDKTEEAEHFEKLARQYEVPAHQAG